MNNTASFENIVCKGGTAEIVISACEARLVKHSSAYNFAFIYATDEMSAHFPELIKRCKQASGIEHWVGTIGIGIISSGKEIYDEPAVSIMLAAFDAAEFTIVPLISNADNLAESLQWPRDFLLNFGVIHADPYNPQAQDLIEELQEMLVNGFLVGGMTSSNNFQYQVADKVDSGGISGVLFSEKIGVFTSLSQGCSPIGKKHHIDRAEQNVAMSLDKRPALDVLMEDTEIKDIDELKNRAADVFAGLCIPNSDQSDYTVRNLIGVDFDHKMFAINDYLDVDSELFFCVRNQESAVRDMQQMLDKLAQRLQGATPRGGIYISCLGRGREQFGENSEEIKMIHETLGDFPLTGFFANGEIHHNRLYAYTGVLTLFT